MDSYILNNALDVYNNSFMLSSMDSSSTFFDPFGPTPFSWELGPKLQSTYEERIPAQSQACTQVQYDAFNHDFASPILSPCPSSFEIKDGMTKYEPYYDESMGQKLAVIKGPAEKAETKHVGPVVDELLVNPSSGPVSPPRSIFEDAYIFPDNTSIDDLWEQMNCGSDNSAASPCPSILTPDTSSTTSLGAVSMPTSPTSTLAFSCPTLEPDVSSSCFGLWARETDLPYVEDGDYHPSATRNEYREIPPKRRVEKQTAQYRQALTQMDLHFVQLPNSPVLKTKQKRKASKLTHDKKRQKVNLEAVCRINGCRHISKTRFECFKHRETHFPGRFRCPHPDCLKVFVRSSSLARHFKRPLNVKCSSFAGSQSEWGVGLINFALRPPAWLEPGFLDDINEF